VVSVVRDSESYERNQMPEMERSVVDAQVKRTHLTRLRPINETKAGTEGAERPVAGDESEAGSEGMGSDEHVHGREGTTPLPRGSAQVGVGSCGSGVPGQNGNAQKELIDEFGELCGLRLQGQAEEKFGFGDGRNADLSHWDLTQMLANRRGISLEGVAHAIGIEHETEHAFFRSEEATFFGRTAVARSEEVGRNFDGVGESKKIVPGAGFARENDVTCFEILADEDFSRGEAEIRRQSDGLAATVLEELGNFSHGRSSIGTPGRRPSLVIYHGISQVF